MTLCRRSGKRSGCIVPEASGRPGYTIDGARIRCEITEGCQAGRYREGLYEEMKAKALRACEKAEHE